VTDFVDNCNIYVGICSSFVYLSSNPFINASSGDTTVLQFITILLNPGLVQVNICELFLSRVKTFMEICRV